MKALNGLRPIDRGEQFHNDRKMGGLRPHDECTIARVGQNANGVGGNLRHLLLGSRRLPSRRRGLSRLSLSFRRLLILPRRSLGSLSRPLLR